MRGDVQLALLGDAVARDARSGRPRFSGYRMALWIGASILAAVPSVGSAALVTYTDKAAFDAASGSTQVETFNSQPVGSRFADKDFGAFTLSYVASPGTPNSGFYRQGSPLNGSTVLFGNTYNDSLRNWQSSFVFEFDQEITSFAGNFNSGNLGRIVLDLLGTSITSTNLGVGNDYFFGITSDTPFKRIELRGSTTNTTGLDFDNITFGSGAAAAVPEPSSWALMIVGFGLTGAALRNGRMRRRQTVTFG